MIARLPLPLSPPGLAPAPHGGVAVTEFGRAPRSGPLFRRDDGTGAPRVDSRAAVGPVAQDLGHLALQPAQQDGQLGLSYSF